MKTIIWDVDDVLNDLMREWLEEAWLPSHPECIIRYADVVENPPHRILGVTLEDYRRSLDHFRSTSLMKLSPVPEVEAWFKANGHRFRNCVLTTVPLRAAGLQAAWVFEHFGPWVRSFNIVPSPRAEEPLPIYDTTKYDFLRWLEKADILIDDNPENVTMAATLGIQAFLVSKPWNDGHAPLSVILSNLAKIDLA
jgi:FMN phosphatase YigB (HAD superfamily)